MRVYNNIYVGLIAIVLFAAACQPRADSTRVDVNLSDANSTGKLAQPAIEASPVLAHDGEYKLVSEDRFTLTVEAPDATEVELIYQPVTAGDRAVLLETLRQSADSKAFTVDLKIPQVFNAEVWGRVKYPSGEVMRDDLFEVTEMVARAPNLPISGRQIAAARKDTHRRVIKLSDDIPVDINYDTMVVENGVLNIYPDVYDRNANTIENLRSELRTFDVDTSKLTDKILRQIAEQSEQ